MRIHWVACALACVLIATLPARLAAQTPGPVPAQPESAAGLEKWGPYALVVGQTMTDGKPEGFVLRWRWQTPGQVLLEEWGRSEAALDKPSYTMTIRLGAEPGNFNLKSSAMLGKEWTGTLQPDGSVSYVGKGMLKMPFTVRVDETGVFEMTGGSKGRVVERYSAITSSASAVVADASSAAPPPAAASTSTPVATTAPTAPAPTATAPEKPAPVVARQASSPPPPPIKLPRKLQASDLDRIRQSVQESRAQSIETARKVELARQEGERQAQLQIQAMLAAQAQREAEDAIADAEFEAERAQKAAEWNQMRQASEQALADSTQRLRNTTAQIQAQQAEAQARQRAQADGLAQAERQRQVELIRQANQRQQDEAARLAAMRQQFEQQRADAQAAENARLQQQRSSAGNTAGAGRASTDTDANRCVSGADVRTDDTTKGNTAAYVSNGCGTPVDMKICLMTESGWKCGVTFGVAAQASWSFSAYRATGPVFVDARVSGGNKPLASPN